MMITATIQIPQAARQHPQRRDLPPVQETVMLIPVFTTTPILQTRMLMSTWVHRMIRSSGDHRSPLAAVLAGAGIHTIGDILILHGTILIMDIIRMPMDTEDTGTVTGMATMTDTGMVIMAIHTITPTPHITDNGECLLPAEAGTYTGGPGSLHRVSHQLIRRVGISALNESRM